MSAAASILDEACQLVHALLAAEVAVDVSVRLFGGPLQPDSDRVEIRVAFGGGQRRWNAYDDFVRIVQRRGYGVDGILRCVLIR